MSEDFSAARQGSAVPDDPATAGVLRTPGLAAGRRQPYSDGKRLAYGLLWAGWTVVLTIAGFALLFGGQILPGLIALVLAVVAGRYDYRIWTWRARRLLFFIIW
jgi:hypothetical protein